MIEESECLLISESVLIRNLNDPDKMSAPLHRPYQAERTAEQTRRIDGRGIYQGAFFLTLFGFTQVGLNSTKLSTCTKDY